MVMKNGAEYSSSEARIARIKGKSCELRSREARAIPLKSFYVNRDLACSRLAERRSLSLYALGQFSRRMKRDDAAFRNGYLFTTFEVARPALGPFLRLKAAKAFELYGFSGFQRDPHLLEYGINHFAALAFAQANLLEEQVLQLFLRQRSSQNIFGILHVDGLVHDSVSIHAPG
jgi:hypothetical protein